MNPMIPVIGDVISTVGKVADDLFTSDEERLKCAIEDRKIDLAQNQGQMAVNVEEAKSSSVFVAGWRPFIGWVGGASLAYQFLLYPFLTWLWTLFQANGWVPVTLAPPPVLPAEALWTIITGMLGIAGMRSFDKKQGTAP